MSIIIPHNINDLVEICDIVLYDPAAHGFHVIDALPEQFRRFVLLTSFIIDNWDFNLYYYVKKANDPYKTIIFNVPFRINNLKCVETAKKINQLNCELSKDEIQKLYLIVSSYSNISSLFLSGSNKYLSNNMEWINSTYNGWYSILTTNMYIQYTSEIHIYKIDQK
jgi:hypothetical protein